MNLSHDTHKTKIRHSSTASGILIAALDSRYHADPTLLTDALAGLTIEETAYAIDHGLNLQAAPNDFLNWGGLNEKWLRGTDGWYFITEDGSFYQWDGKPSASGTLITVLSATYYSDLTLLASTSSVGTMAEGSILDNVFVDLGNLLLN